jgi:magnesium transporter
VKKDFKTLVKDRARPVHTVVHEQNTIEQALESLRKKKFDDKIIYFYVVDSENRLQGIVPTRTLLLRDPHTKISSIMEKSVIRLQEDQNLEQAMKALSHHRLLALPVVDEKQKLKGVIDVQLYLEENVDLFKAQRNLDVFQMLGMTLEEGLYRSPWKGYSKRMPWIFCNMIGGLACAAVSRMFEMVLGKVLILAMFIPIVLSLSESISMQSMTQSFQILRSQNISFKRVFLRIYSEVRTVALMSFTSGILVGVISLFWKTGFAASATIAVGIIVSVSLSAMIGSSIPLLLHLRRLDPKVASGPVVLTFADVITTSIYLSLATWWLL